MTSTMYRENPHNLNDVNPAFVKIKIQLTPLFYFCFLMGFISAQRFFLAEISALVCILLLCSPVILGFHRKEYFTILFLSVVSMVDLGGVVYSETPSSVKYLIYLISIGFIYYACGYKYVAWHRYLIIYVLIVILNTFLHPNTLDGYTISRDLLTLYLILLVSFSSNIKNIKSINFNLILSFSLGIMISELINIVFNYTVISGEYLNYSSFKFLALFPIIYMLSLKRYYIASLLAPFTFAVIGVYGSRMLLLSGIVVCLLLLFGGLRQYFWRTFALTTISAALAIFMLNAVNINFESYRVISIFLAITQYQDFAAAALFLDPVRYAENSVFFGQNPYLLLFGNGVGTGMLDTTGVFAFVPDDGAAFSPRELSESHFFRLHDSWTWIGYRFGFLPYLAFVFWGVKGCLSKDPLGALFAAFMLLALLNATFSIGGLIACAIIGLHYKLKDHQVQI